MAVVGDEADASLTKRAGSVAADLDPRDPDVAAAAAIYTGGRTDEFALPANSGAPTIFALAGKI
jgi:hypothetical protein